MSEIDTTKEEQTEKVRPGILGGPKPPNSGRQKGTPNKKSVLQLETIRAQAAEELTRSEEKEKNAKQYTADGITGVRILYLYANKGWRALGLNSEKSITEEMQLDAASKLANFEVPKKRAVEVTGVELAGGAYFLSGGKPAPEGETTEEWAERSARETAELEAETKRNRLKQLEEEKAADRK